MAKDRDVDGIEEEDHEEELEESDDFEGDEVDVATFDIESDDIGDSDDDDYDDSVSRSRTPVKRRTVTRAVPMVEGVPKSKLDQADIAKTVWDRMSERAEGLDVVTYAISGSYQVGQVVDHKKFGRGFVIEVIPPQKVEILFEDGLRKLVYGR